MIEKWRITAKGIATMEEGLRGVEDPDVRRLGLKMLEILTRDGDLPMEECVRRAVVELREIAPKAPPKDLS